MYLFQAGGGKKKKTSSEVFIVLADIQKQAQNCAMRLDLMLFPLNNKILLLSNSLSLLNKFTSSWRITTMH